MSPMSTLVPGNGSTSSLRGTETDSIYVTTPPATTYLTPPPALHLEVYSRKPLPPIPPPKRNSVASTLSKEMSRAFETPLGSAGLGHGHGHDHNHGQNSDRWSWTKEEAEIDGILQREVRPNPALSTAPPKKSSTRASRKAKSKIDTMNRAVPNTPPDELLSPQPRSSVPKILQLTTVRPAKSNSSSSPSGHNSPHKIKQLTGIDVAAPEDYRRWLAEDRAVDVSPLSNRSSSYSQDTDPIVSDPDSIDIELPDPKLKGCSPDNSSYFAQRYRAKGLVPGTRPPIPSPLNITKTNMPQPAQHPQPQHPSSGPWHHPRQQYTQDLYHATAAQLARFVPNTPPLRSPPKQTNTIPYWVTESSGPASTNSLPSYSTNPYPPSINPYPNPHPYPHQYSPSPQLYQTATNTTFGPHHLTPSPSPDSPSPTRNRRSIISKVFSKRTSDTPPPTEHTSQPQPSPQLTVSDTRTSTGRSIIPIPKFLKHSSDTPPPSTDQVQNHRQGESFMETNGNIDTGGSTNTGGKWPPGLGRLPSAMANVGSLVAGRGRRAERKRESLKKTIVVVGEGGQVLGGEGRVEVLGLGGNAAAAGVDGGGGRDTGIGSGRRNTSINSGGLDGEGMHGAANRARGENTAWKGERGGEVGYWL
ncbi:hypothetical protein OQA88_3598 [Cercophora sp. LCS_1]